MPLFKANGLSVADKISVLQQAKRPLQLQIQHGVVCKPDLRATICDGLIDCRYIWGTSVGSKREVSVTIEIANALGLGSHASNVDRWSNGKNAQELLAALDATIAFLGETNKGGPVR